MFFEWKYHTSGFLGRETHETGGFAKVEWVSQAKKSTSVMFPLKKHTSAVFYLSHATLRSKNGTFVTIWSRQKRAQKLTGFIRTLPAYHAKLRPSNDVTSAIHRSASGLTTSRRHVVCCTCVMNSNNRDAL